MKLLVAVELVVLVAIAGIWLMTRDDARGNLANDGLRGSLPPASQQWPALAAIESIEPSVPASDELGDHATMLVATCADCRSGDIIGGFLGRLGEDALPEDARVHVVAWGGDVDGWVERSGIDVDRMVVHDASDEEATARVRRMLGIAPLRGADESGIAFLYDPSATWRATYAIGQLDREDIAHDLEQLGNE